MIIVVKNRNTKRLAIKSLAVFSLFAIFYLYYNHMSNKFAKQNQVLSTKLEIKEEVERKLNDKSVKIENTIYKEALTLVKLLGQKHVQSVKVVKEQLLIICDFTTDIEPVLIRYGANAMVKHTKTNIKIALDLKTIVENKYES